MTAGQRHDRSALILYGSETGKSQDAAEDLGRLAERLHFVTRVCEMDEVEIKQILNQTVVIFVISTTGQGEFPKNARKFWRRLLRKSLPHDCLTHVTYTSFGLGDSSYTKFNWAARKLHKRFGQLGAEEFYPRGEGDEQHDEGIEGAFLPWSTDLARNLLAQHPLPEGISPVPEDVLLPPKYQLLLSNAASTALISAKNNVTTNENLAAAPSQSVDNTLSSGKTNLPVPNAITAELLQNMRITPNSHWQDVRHIKLSVPSGSLPDYEPGDVITIYPKNFEEDVQKLINLMEWSEVADLPLVFESTSLHYDLQTIKGLYTMPNTTLRQLLIHNLDITAIPNRYFFHQISHYTEDQMHKDRLLEFCNPVFTDEFYDYTARPRRSILEVLEDFPSVKLPWQHITTIFPLIRGRQFSIASGGILAHTTSGYTSIELVVAIVRYRTVLKKIRQGLCSRYLVSLPVGEKLTITFSENSKFYEIVKKEPHRPVIMIAPGTGVAPCRSLIHSRAQLNPQTIGTNLLFFANRNASADFFFSSEYPSLPVKVITAFSRDQLQKIYIQDRVREHGGQVKSLVEEGAVVYVCGSSGAMPRSVKEALISVLGEDLVIGLEGEGRLLMECW